MYYSMEEPDMRSLRECTPRTTVGLQLAVIFMSINLSSHVSIN